METQEFLVFSDVNFRLMPSSVTQLEIYLYL